MKGKTVGVTLLVVLGVYFLLFHASHEAIGLPPYHTLHSVFGLILLGAAFYLGRKK